MSVSSDRRAYAELTTSAVSAGPYTLHFGDPFHQLVVQVPKRELMLRDTRPLTARALRRGTPGGAVSAFFTSLFDATRVTGEQPAVLLPHAIGLLSAAASSAGWTEPAPAAAAALARERVLEFLRRNLADPSLDADAVAAACHVSRRTLYRIVGPEGVAARLRRMRIEQARSMLLREPARTHKSQVKPVWNRRR